MNMQSGFNDEQLTAIERKKRSKIIRFASLLLNKSGRHVGVAFKDANDDETSLRAHRLYI